MTTATDCVISITETALEQIVALREQEAIPDLHLGLRIAGVGPQGFVYETAFLREADVDQSDHIEHHGDLPVAIAESSVDNLRGSVLDISSDPDLESHYYRSIPVFAIGDVEVELVTSARQVRDLLERAAPSPS